MARYKNATRPSPISRTSVHGFKLLRLPARWFRRHIPHLWYDTYGFWRSYKTHILLIDVSDYTIIHLACRISPRGSPRSTPISGAPTHHHQPSIHPYGCIINVWAGLKASNRCINTVAMGVLLGLGFLARWVLLTSAAPPFLPFGHGKDAIATHIAGHEHLR